MVVVCVCVCVCVCVVVGGCGGAEVVLYIIYISCTRPPTYPPINPPTLVVSPKPAVRITGDTETDLGVG